MSKKYDCEGNEEDNDKSRDMSLTSRLEILLAILQSTRAYSNIRKVAEPLVYKKPQREKSENPKKYFRTILTRKTWSSPHRTTCLTVSKMMDRFGFLDTGHWSGVLLFLASL